MRKNRIFTQTILALAISVQINFVKAQGLKGIDFLIGRWEVSEEVFPGTEQTYVESGIRTCQYDVDSTYIKCISKAKSKYDERELHWYINYEKENDRFIHTTLFSNLSFQGRYDWYLDSANQKIHSISPFDSKDDYFYRGEIEIFEDELIWKGYRNSFRKERDWELRYVERSRRVE